MQTTSQNDSMSMDFFQVGGYKNIAGVSAGLISEGASRAGSKSKKLSQLALLGNVGSTFTKMIFRKYGTAFSQAKEMTGLSTRQIDDLYVDFQLDGQRDVNKFPDWALENSGTENVFKEQIIADVEEMANVPESEMVMVEPKGKMGTMQYLYIALGVLAVVGVTVLIVKRK
tara:strand:+ start:11856 stop:12368 length:513 start_codon:yes stop_codon:yes gene_type:complete